MKHLVECHCILPLYKNSKKPIYHKFAVYSKIDDAGNVISKYVNCNNCGIVHLVYEYCKSDIKIGKEDAGSIRTIKDISISLPERIVSVLKEYDSTIDIYEEIEDIFDNDIFPKQIVIKREIIEENQQLKILEIKSKDSFKILSETINTTLIKNWGLINELFS